MPYTLQHLTRKERLTRAYSHREMDRPAVYSRTGFPADDPSYDRLKAYLREHTELKRSWSISDPMHGYPVTQVREPYSEDFERWISRLHTPGGDLHATWLSSLKGEPGYQASHFISCRSDAEKYLSLPVAKPEGDTAAFRVAEQEMGERGIVEVGIGMNPAGFAAELCGSESFALLSVTDRDILHALCERRMNCLLDMVKFYVSHGLGPFFSMSGEEYVAPPLHGPQDFEDFNVRYDKPIVDAIHNARGWVHIHCHGHLKRVMGGLLRLGVDVLHPFENPPTGDITAREVKALARGRITLEGNINISHMYDHTPEQVRQETQALIHDAFGDHAGVIVSPSASPYIRGAGELCFEQYKAMIDAVVGHKNREAT